MEEKVFKIKVVNEAKVSPIARTMIQKEVAKQTPEFKQNYKGFVKITYVTASPVRIKSIEPIEGTVQDYFNKVEGANSVRFC